MPCDPFLPYPIPRRHHGWVISLLFFAHLFLVFRVSIDTNLSFLQANAKRRIILHAYMPNP